MLSPSELTALARALKLHEQQHPTSVAAIRVTALTGLRVGEVLAIRWQDIGLRYGAADPAGDQDGATRP